VYVCNNVFDATFSPAAFWANSPGDMLPHSVHIANNIMRSRNGQGVLFNPEAMKMVTDSWRIGPNTYSVAPKDRKLSPTGPDGVSWAKAEKDSIVDMPFLSLDPEDANYLRIAADGPLATGGAGGDLPSYFGAFPPGPRYPDIPPRGIVLLTPRQSEV
jgi:hypothetical protein